MNASSVIFYLISAFILGAGILAVSTAKIVRSAIWLLFSLVGVAALYFWMQVEFIAAIQIVIYVGGIVVLIIFSIFLTQQSGKEMPKPELKRKLAAAIAVLLGFSLSYRLIAQYGFTANTAKPFTVQVSDVGTQMLSTTGYGFALPFEVVNILLLAAMIGCIVIAMKAPEEKAIPTAKETEDGRMPEERIIVKTITGQTIKESERMEEPL